MFFTFLSREIQTTYEKTILIEFDRLWFVRLISTTKEKFHRKISSKYISEIFIKHGNCLNEFSFESLAEGILEECQEGIHTNWKNKNDFFYIIIYYLEDQKMKLLLRIKITGESIQLIFYANERDLNDDQIMMDHQRFIQCHLIHKIFKNYF